MLLSLLPTGSADLSCMWYYYHTLAKEGSWAVHLTLGQDWGMGRYLDVKERPDKLPTLSS